MIRPDQKYHGTVAAGSQLIQSQTGTMGFQVQLDCEDGATSFIIWMTPKNKERAQKAFVEALGVDEEKLLDANYFEYMLASEIIGRPVTFTTVEEEYKGNTKVKVAFLFKRSTEISGKAAAGFFGAKFADDDDIPF
jgi:hypothetical protein